MSASNNEEYFDAVPDGWMENGESTTGLNWISSPTQPIGGVPGRYSTSSAFIDPTSNGIRTIPSANKINLKKRSVQTGMPDVGRVSIPFTTHLAAGQTNYSARYGSDFSQWQTVPTATRRGGHRSGPQQRNAAFSPRKPIPMAVGQLPGEYITVDNLPTFVVWSTDVEMARRSIAQNHFVFILMRGVPGSGKSTLAKSLKGNGIICSADEYFIQEDNTYRFDPTRLGDAHDWCLQRALQAIARRVSPVIIDNTNLRLWEMSKYIKPAVRNSYEIYFLEPGTSWRRDPNKCAKRNTHHVTVESIERMLMQFEPVVSIRPFMEAGLLRNFTQKNNINVERGIPSNEPSTSKMNSPTAYFTEPKMRDNKEPTDLQSESDDWESSAPITSSWETEERPKAYSEPPYYIAPQVDTSPLDVGPKEQRIRHETSETKVMEADKRDVKETGRLDEQATETRMEETEERMEKDEERMEGTEARMEETESKAPELEKETSPELHPTIVTEVEPRMNDKASMEMKKLDMEEMKFTEPKRLDGTPTRRKRPSGIISLNAFTRGSWTLPEDLVGGLSSRSLPTGTDKSNVPDDTSGEDKIAVTSAVADASSQVTEKHLALANMSHRRLARRSIDDSVCGIDERPTLKVSLDASVVFTCDTGVQCDYDTSVVTASDGEGYRRATETLRSCFPQVDKEDIEEMFKDCDYRLEWTINLLLDSGYDVDWNTKIKNGGKDVPGPEVVSEEDPEAESEGTDRLRVESASGKKMDAVQNERPVNEADLLSESPPSYEDSDEDESPLYTMELSVDMATQLQRIFTPIIPDVPSDILGPKQLKFRLPQHLAAALYRCWLDTQINGTSKDDDSDFLSDEVSDDAAMAQDTAIAGSRSNDSRLDRDTGWNDSIERQIRMDERLALQLLAEDEYPADTTNDASPAKVSTDSMASKIKLNRLYELFPSADKSFLKAVFNATGCHLDQTIDTLCHDYCIPQAPPGSSSKRKANKVQEDEQEVDEIANVTYEQLRQEAVAHYQQRDMYFKKAQEYHRKGMPSVATYYSQKGHAYNAKFREANELAGKKILQQRRAENPEDVLDLHGLHVNEAVHALVDTLDEYKNRSGKEIRIITGQGIHSSNGAKIKPAVVNYLRQRGHKYSYTELTPGALLVKIR